MPSPPPPQNMWLSAQTITLTIGDGAGGFMQFPLSKYLSIQGAPTADPTFAVESLILNYLNAAWGAIVANGNGIAQTPITGTGNGSWADV